MAKFKASTHVAIENSEAALNAFLDHARDDHGLEYVKQPDGKSVLTFDSFRVSLRAEPSGLSIDLVSPTESSLVFMRENIVTHIAEIDPAAAEGLRWTGGGATAGDLPANFQIGRLLHRQIVFEGLIRLTYSVPNAQALATGGLHARLITTKLPNHIPTWPRLGENGVPTWPEGDDELHARFITFRHVRQTRNEVDIDIADHDGGLIAELARNAKIGSEVGLMGPGGDDRRLSGERVFLAADATGLAAIARLVEAAIPDIKGQIIAPAPDDYDLRRYMPPAPGIEICRCQPGQFDHVALKSAAEFAKGGPVDFAFFAGEFDTAQAMRQIFKQDMRLNKATQISTAYWRKNAPGVAL